MRYQSSILALLLGLGIYGAGPIVAKYGWLAAAPALADSGESEGHDSGDGGDSSGDGGDDDQGDNDSSASGDSGGDDDGGTTAIKPSGKLFDENCSGVKCQPAKKL